MIGTGSSLVVVFTMQPLEEMDNCIRSNSESFWYAVFYALQRILLKLFRSKKLFLNLDIMSSGRFCILSLKNNFFLKLGKKSNKNEWPLSSMWEGLRGRPTKQITFFAASLRYIANTPWFCMARSGAGSWSLRRPWRGPPQPCRPR